MEWTLNGYDSKGMNKTVVALANKIVRIVWKILKMEGMSEKFSFISIGHILVLIGP